MTLYSIWLYVSLNSTTRHNKILIIISSQLQKVVMLSSLIQSFEFLIKFL